MDITYDILVDEAADGNGRDFLDSFIDTKSEALKLLKECRKKNSQAYVVKVVRTRCREPKLQR